MAALEMDNGHDRRLLRRAIKERWPIALAHREEYLAALRRALAVAERPRDIASIVKTAAALDHLNIEWGKLSRADAGLPSEIKRYVFEFDSPDDVDIAEALPEAEEGDLRR